MRIRAQPSGETTAAMLMAVFADDDNLEAVRLVVGEEVVGVVRREALLDLVSTRTRASASASGTACCCRGSRRRAT
ncbi:MAG: hypothetical protein ACR2LJ_09260 [Acidimicrobiales bacterium]